VTQCEPDSKALNKKHAQPPVKEIIKKIKKHTHTQNTNLYILKSIEINSADSALKSRRTLKTVSSGGFN